MNTLPDYFKLMRLDKPIGILLLWYPTAWALWIAVNHTPSSKLLFLFSIGTILMRAAGCVINDIADRNIDKHIQRTRERPLTSGKLGLKQAFIVLFILLCCALSILIALPLNCLYLALVAVGITFIYPFCKRFINAPQVILGLAFSMGIPMAFAASGQSLTENTIFLFLINFSWIVSYDTMYAMTDKDDDLKIGVKSTAIYFANSDKLIIGLLQIAMHILWLFLAFNRNFYPIFYLCWSLAILILVYQQKLISTRDPQHCFKAFLISNYYGLLMWIALILNFW